MKQKKPWAIALSLLGVILIVGSIVWITVIEPKYEKLPTDLDDTLTADAKIIDTLGLLGLPSTTTEVTIERIQRAIGTENGVLIIEEKIEPSIEIPDIGITRTTLTMGVDRDSREYVSGYGDREREALWAYPIGTEKQDYVLWSDTAGSAPVAQFDGEDKLDGLSVYNFITDVKDIPYDFDLYGITVPVVMDYTIKEQVEPNTGITVNFQSERIAKVWITSDLLAMLSDPGVAAVLPDSVQPLVSMLPKEVGPEGLKLPVVTVTQAYSEETVAEKISDAKHYKTQLLWATRYGLWLGIGIGIVSLLAGCLLFLRSNWPKRWRTESSDASSVASEEQSDAPIMPNIRDMPEAQA